MSERVYRVLDRPRVYGLAQKVLAPGAEAAVTRRISDLLAKLPAGEPLLDLGCGPRSWLRTAGRSPIGLDINPAYIAAYGDGRAPGVVGSADRIPFRDGSIAGVWSIGLLHHLPDQAAIATMREAIRVCRPGGYVAILDAVLPSPAWRRPLAALIRKLDRGRFMRGEEAFQALLPNREQWICERFTYATTGLEMLGCVFRNIYSMMANDTR